MRLTIEFLTPFTRAQLRTFAVNLQALFPATTVVFRAASSWDDHTATLDSELDSILGMKVDNLATIQEAGEFLQALPAGANGRIQEISIQ
jgi:hypothetical protein